MDLYWTKRGIPHGFLCETPIHLIYRLEDCAPVHLLKELKDDLLHQIKGLRAFGRDIQALLEEHSKIYDNLLDAQDQRKFILNRDELGQIVLQSWLHLSAQKEITLYAVVVMGNHVHVLLRGFLNQKPKQIGKLIQRHKSFTTKAIRAIDNSIEKVWDYNFYDRYVREGTFWRVLDYIVQNPVKAGMVERWDEWPLTYVDRRCLEHPLFLSTL